MSSKSTWLESAILNHIYRTATLSKPANLWIALHTADPTEAGATAEVSGSGTAYARRPITLLDAGWDAPADDGEGRQFITNIGDIVWAEATGGSGFGVVTHFSIKDSATIGAGNCYHYGPLVDVAGDPISRNVSTGVVFSIPDGMLLIAEG